MLIRALAVQSVVFVRISQIARALTAIDVGEGDVEPADADALVSEKERAVPRASSR